jgi:hypothetical protein
MTQCDSVKHEASAKISLGRSKSPVVVRVIADASNILGMFNFIVRPNDEDRASEYAVERAARDQDSVILAERGVPMIAGGDDLIDIGGAAPALLSERQVHADTDNLHVGKLACFFVKPFSF